MTRRLAGRRGRSERRLAGRVLGVLVGLALTVQAHAAAMSACETGDPADRIVACDAIIADAGSDAATRSRALVGRGYAELYRSNDNVAALADFTAATKLDPGNAEAFIGMGKMHYFLEQMDEAQAAFATATQLAPDDPVAWNTLGKVYHFRGDYAAALTHFDRAIEADHRHPNANLNRADTLYALGRKGEALAGYRFCLYLFKKNDHQYGHVVDMIDRLERELAAQ